MNEALFKTTVMGGFSKSEVLSFIDKQDKQFKDREKDLLAQIAALNKNLGDETKRSSQLAGKVSELGKELEAEKASHEKTKSSLADADDTLNRAKEEVTAEINKRNERIEALTMRINQMTTKEQLAETRSADADKRAEEAENKLKLIDKTEDQIGRALLEAQKTADAIKESAKKEAEDILARAHGEADELITSSNEKIRCVKDEAKTKLDNVLLKVGEFKSESENVHAKAADFMSFVEDQFNEIEANAQDILNKYKDAFNYDPEEAELTVANVINAFGGCCEGEDSETQETEESGETQKCDIKDTEETDEAAKEEAAAIKFDFSSKN